MSSAGVDGQDRICCMQPAGPEGLRISDGLGQWQCSCALWEYAVFVHLVQEMRKWNRHDLPPPSILIRPPDQSVFIRLLTMRTLCIRQNLKPFASSSNEDQVRGSHTTETALLTHALNMATDKQLKLWELAGAEDGRVFSPFAWRVRLVLVHKGLEFQTIPWRYSQKDLIKPADKV